MPDVTIIGGGPAGLTAACTLISAGVRNVHIIERNPEFGGLPRFCGHYGWGMLDFGRVWRGPEYARALVKAAQGASFHNNTSLTHVYPDGKIVLNTPTGLQETQSRAVILTTGIRETPRGPRLVSGTRPWGVTTTGAFQEMVAYGTRPFSRPVIIGSEFVSFSALLTSRHAGITPVALIEEKHALDVPSLVGLGSRYMFGVPIVKNTSVLEIEGTDRVEAVIVGTPHEKQRIPCDGVIFTGRFVPETASLAGGAIAMDHVGTHGPSIDNFHRCSDPAYFAAGNILRAVEHSGYVAHEGRQAARSVIRMLKGQLPSPERKTRVTSRGLRYVYPHFLIPDDVAPRLSGRLLAPHNGRIVLLSRHGNLLASRRIFPWQGLRFTFKFPWSILKGHEEIQVSLD